MIFSNDGEKKWILIEKLKTITVDDFNAFLHHKNITIMCSMCHQVGEQIIDETDFKNIMKKPSANRFVTFFHHQPVIHGDSDINYYYKLTCHHCGYITTYSVSGELTLGGFGYGE